MYKSHGKAYPKWLQTSLDRNWDGVAWNLIQGMAQCFFTQWLLFVWEKTFQTICYYDSWLCHALPWAKWNWLLRLSSARSGPALAPKEWGPAKLLAASPAVYLCFVPARLEDFLFFFPYLLHLSTSRAPERSVWNFAAYSSSAEHALEHPAFLGLNLLGTWTFQHQTPLNKCLVFKVIFPCVTVT